MIRMRKIESTELSDLKLCKGEKKRQIEEAQMRFDAGEWTKCDFLYDTPPEIIEVKLVRKKELARYK